MTTATAAGMAHPKRLPLSMARILTFGHRTG